MPTFSTGSGVGDNYATFLLYCPDVSWFKQNVLGALDQMTYVDNWVENGDVGTSFAVEESEKMIETCKVMNFNPFPIGMIFPFGSSTTPVGYLPCDGSNYSEGDYPELFAVIGTLYGGGSGNFNVPNIENKTPIGSGDLYSIASVGGEAMHTLDTSEIPSHSHSIPLTTTTLAVEPGEVTVLTPIPILTSDTGSTGGGSSHNNLQPYLAVPYIIYAGR
jgi:microcystin-dependent protein